MLAPDGAAAFARFTSRNPLLLVGCGRMGGALLQGWLRSGLDPAALFVVDPAASADTLTAQGLTAGSVVAEPQALPRGIAPLVIVLSVKPQVMDEAVGGIRPFTDGGAAIVSIAAGKSLGYFKAKLGAHVPVVRAMPNTPAAIGRGITAAVANAKTDAAMRHLAETLMSAVGAFVWLDHEKHMDAVTAVSGSGPAYVFYLTECLASAGAAAGLPPDLSHKLALHTVAGAGALLIEGDKSPAALREAVTSPAGTTAAALDILMSEKGLSVLLRKAVAAAAKRSRELA